MSGPGIQLRVEPFGFPEVQAAMRRLVLTGRGLKQPLTAAGRYLLRRTHENFAGQHGPDGAPWPELSPVTIALRHRKKAKKTRAARAGVGLPGGDKALFVTGRLEASIQFNASDTELAVGTNRKFPGGDKSAAAIHQLGGKAGRGDSVTIPARPFLGVTDGDARAIGDLFVEAIRLASL
jgi:phage virion morphogenesis protein